MSFVKPKFVLLAFLAGAAPLLAVSACSGEAFTGVDSGGTTSGGRSAAAGAGASSGRGAASGNESCGGPEDCDDGDVCTTDFCEADGTCGSAPKCGGTEHCCAGECAECCSNDDCDDGVSCTENHCFMRQCVYVPDDEECPPNAYCATGRGCRPKKACGILAGEDATTSCADEDACTTDSCGQDNFCRHDYCPTEAGALCCEGVGCAECCSDAQCDTDDDPCTVGSCQGGKCTRKPRCESGQCCPSADGKSATCAACCGVNDCDDKEPCTVDKCAGSQCSHTPDSSRCPPGSYCDLQGGCVEKAMCAKASDCTTSGCQTARCAGGVCEVTDCASGTKCCKGGASAGKCAVCCDAEECNDNVTCTVDACGANGCTHTPNDALCPAGQSCDGKRGCIQCTTAKECDDQVPCTTDSCVENVCVHASTCSGKTPYCGAAGCVACLADSDCHGGVIGTPQAAVIAGCQNTRCVSGACKTTYPSCDIGFCCAPYGCMTKGCLQ